MHFSKDNTEGFSNNQLRHANTTMDEWCVHAECPCEYHEGRFLPLDENQNDEYKRACKIVLGQLV